MVLRKVRVKADADAGMGRIQVRQRLVDGRLGEAECLDRPHGHMPGRFREFATQDREHPFGQHLPDFPGYAGDDGNHLSLLLQGETGCRPDRIGDQLRPFGKVRLFGVVFRPVQAVFFEDSPNVPKDGFVPAKRQPEGAGNRGGRDVVGRGSETPCDDNRIALGQNVAERLLDEEFVIADGHHQTHLPSLRAENTGHHGRVGVLCPAAGQLVADGKDPDFHEPVFIVYFYIFQNFSRISRDRFAYIPAATSSRTIP